MSTINDIPERRAMTAITLSQCIRAVVDSCCDAGLNNPPSTDAALAAGVQMYRLEHWLNDRDTHDEQMSGIADCINGITDEINNASLILMEVNDTRQQ